MTKDVIPTKKVAECEIYIFDEYGNGIDKVNGIIIERQEYFHESLGKPISRFFLCSECPALNGYDAIDKKGYSYSWSFLAIVGKYSFCDFSFGKEISQNSVREALKKKGLDPDKVFQLDLETETSYYNDNDDEDEDEDYDYDDGNVCYDISAVLTKVYYEKKFIKIKI